MELKAQDQFSQDTADLRQQQTVRREYDLMILPLERAISSCS